MNLTKTYELPFPVAKVYAAWVSNDTVIPPATKMDIDAKPGGHYILHAETDEFSARCEGRFTRVEPESRLTYTWAWDHDGQVSTIDVLFGTTDSGTAISLQHDGLIGKESLASHSSGWDNYIAGLKRFLADKRR